MWTRRKVFPTQSVPVTPHLAAITTPAFQQHTTDSSGSPFTTAESDFHFVAGLAYTLVPSLSPQEAAQLLHWALPPSWRANADAPEAFRQTFAFALRNEAVLRACSQVEYFFFGTDNGQVFLMPLLPLHFLQVLLQACDHGEVGEDDGGRLTESARALRRKQKYRTAVDSEHNGAAQGAVPINCGGRRLLHRHVREEPVTALDHLGTLCVSAASDVDTGVCVSVFHPVPVGLVCIPHPSPVRCVKLWEGTVFTAAVEKSTTAEADANEECAAQRERWHKHVQNAEPTAVYVCTGDNTGLVRLWRVGVATCEYSLQHVLVCSLNVCGMRSPLSPFAREDHSRVIPSRHADTAVHCLAIDVASNRLYGGAEGGAFVWALDALPWRGPDVRPARAAATTRETPAPPSHSPAASLAVHHPFCWDEAHRAPLPCALLHWSSTTPDSANAKCGLAAPSQASEKIVAYRTSRLANHHVWVLPAPDVQSEMARAQQHGLSDKVSGWKSKYGRVMTGGAAVGVVSNSVELHEAANDAEAKREGVSRRLTDTAVTVSFEGGELKNDLRVPLSCVVPVLYPCAFLRTAGTACFAVQVLASKRRVLTSCSDGRVCVWGDKADGDEKHASAVETYVPQLVTSQNQEHRGLGRHLCVLRSPDVFVSCSFDDGLVKEWHVYDEPEPLLRCLRRFTLTPHVTGGKGGGGEKGGAGEGRELANALKSMVGGGTAEEDKEKDGDGDSDAALPQDGDVVAGIACAVAYPAFGALFLVGAFESAIQAYSLAGVVGCEPPRNFIYNGTKTVRLPASMAEDVYHEL